MGLFAKKPNPQLAGRENQKTLHKNLEFTASEQYRLLRTNIFFTLPEVAKCPIIGVTSANRSEGKSTTAINLSYVLAEREKRVLLIDGDMRLPSVAKKMNLDNAPGLSNLLMGAGADISQWQSSVQKNWYILPSGDIPPNPSELLGSRRMGNVLASLRESFDYIVIDLPPVNVVSDAMSVARFIDGMVLVAREGYTGKKDLEQCVRQINLSNVNLLGCVLNGCASEGGSYGKGKYYKQNYAMADNSAKRKKR